MAGTQSSKAALLIKLLLVLVIAALLVTSTVMLSQAQEPSTSPLISNGVVCVQFNNPPPYPGGTYPVHWDVFKVALNGGNPCNYPNLFIGDLRAGETVHLYYYNGYSGDGDGDSAIGPYTQLYIVNSNTILGVINVPSGLTEKTYYELVGNLPVVYVNFTVSNTPQPTMFWYGINFINDIYVDPNPGETSWVVALGVGNYSFSAQNPQEMYNLAINWGFRATLTSDQFTPGYFAEIYVPASAGSFTWMEIDQPGIGTYYLALYPLTPIDGYYIVSANGWAFNKVIGLIFANNTVSASGALLVVYGTSLSNLQQNINEALTTLGLVVSHVVLPPSSYFYLRVIAPDYANWTVYADASDGWYAYYSGSGSMSFGPAYVGGPGTTVTFNVTSLGNCPSPLVTYEPSNTLLLSNGANYETIVINCQPMLSVDLNVTGGGGVIALINEPGLGITQLMLNGPTNEVITVPMNTTVTIYAWPNPGYTLRGIYINGTGVIYTENMFGTYTYEETINKSQTITIEFSGNT